MLWVLLAVGKETVVMGAVSCMERDCVMGAVSCMERDCVMGAVSCMERDCVMGAVAGHLVCRLSCTVGCCL